MSPKKYFTEHCSAGPKNLILVTLFTEGEPDWYGVFDSFTLAKSWADSRDDYENAIFAPFIVNNPYFGNERGRQ